jgi:hypothetical protein
MGMREIEPSIPVGRRVVVTGVAGAGKSTFSCLGLERADAVLVLDTPRWTCARRSDRERELIIVAQYGKHVALPCSGPRGRSVSSWKASDSSDERQPGFSRGTVPAHRIPRSRFANCGTAAWTLTVPLRLKSLGKLNRWSPETLMRHDPVRSPSPVTLTAVGYPGGIAGSGGAGAPESIVAQGA